jgi:hypothetical protein
VNGRLAELHLGQYLAEVIKTASPRWSNAPDRHAQLLGDRLVREIVIAHQQAKEALATRRQPFGCHSYRYDLLLSQEGGIERIGLVICHVVHRIGRRDRGSSGGDPEALAPRGRRQPRTEAFRLLDAVQVLHEAQPRRLTHFSNIGITQPAASGDCRHQPAKALDECLPSFVCSGASLRHNPKEITIVR